MKVKLKDVAAYSKGQQINGNELLEDAQFDYLNGGITPSGKWGAYNTPAQTVTISEGGNSCGYINYMRAPFWCGAHCYYLYDVKGNSLYLYYALKSQQEKIMALRSGACMPNIKKVDLGNFEFEFDDNPGNQKLIVKTLQGIDSIIEKKKRQLELFDQLGKSRFIEMFGDPVGNPRGWAKVSLGKRCEIITGNTPPRAEEENYGTYIEWIKSDNINTPNTFLTVAQEYLSEMGFKKCRYVEEGSILMTCIAGSVACIGNVAITDRRVAFNQQINAIVPKQDEVLYLYWLILLSKPAIHSTINMALKGILSKGQLSKMEFPFPPLALQKQFAVFVEQVDKSKSAVKKSLEELEILKKSLMQKYFT